MFSSKKPLLFSLDAWILRPTSGSITEVPPLTLMAVGPSASAVAVQFLREKIGEKMSGKIYSPCEKKWLLNGDPYNGGEFNGDLVGG